MDKPTIPEVLPFIKDYYSKDGNGVGGSLHIVLDDGNIDDDSVKYCLGCAKKRGDIDGVKIAETLLLMSKTQRKKICGLIF